MPKLIAWSLVAMAVLSMLVLANMGRRTAGVSFAPETPEARLARLAPHWTILRPDGTASGNGAILLSGCDGVHDNMRFWAEEFVRQGRVALILDSHRPRDLDRMELWRLVCAGQLLDGGERSGDLAVALHALSESEGVTGDLVILGASHGGWAAMEFVARAGDRGELSELIRWPEPPHELLARVSGLALLYPYCGILNGADAESWRSAPPTLMILAEADSIVGDDCVARARALRAGGARVDVATIPGANHGFDQQEKALFSTLAFDSGQRDEALGHLRTFLSDLAGEGGKPARAGAEDR
ncbi:dienelactone hydrolase family protein [Lutibaculum baratangense]|uniref:Uncharacterized protein n=1 Tax=Lutibaculum baratangense AMV1 TaxID=631454 RepID=V4RC59_9HYPH|nr:alpha/beta hydrolase fold domain-containing protein [Lutibaculum baratangense]ESR23756.1 hypothetical protein N177_2986 [Lutibaculum baratangense AMV1]